VPLVVALHASGGYPATFEAGSGLDAVAKQHGFVVAYLGSPEPTSPAWRLVDMSRNLAYVSSEIKSLTMSENIDPKRVYVTGFSAGASMAYFVGCQLSSQVDGIAPVSGAMEFTDPCHISHPVSELEVIGTSDAIPINGSALLLSDVQMAALWRRLDGCVSQSSTTVTGPVSEYTWNRCNEGSGVKLFVIQGGTHQWPGPGAGGTDARFSAAQAVWAFFEAHPGTSSTQVSARLLSLRARVHNSDRQVRVVLALGSPVQALATLARGRDVVASQRFKLPSAEAASLVLLVPRRAGGGRYTIKLVLLDSHGRHLTIVRTIGVPGPPG
jgi:polyhydroxybutyrate depolymerase